MAARAVRRPAGEHRPEHDADGTARETAELAIQHNYQLAIHAIGDRANREMLNLYEAAFKGVPNTKDLRWRDEHAQHLNAADIPRFGRSA